jgi:Fur family transcriptional regulator, ferric uptake regulator
MNTRPHATRTRALAPALASALASAPASAARSESVTRPSGGVQRDVNAEQLKERFAAFLRENKFRHTPERFGVVDSLLKFDTHFSADELYLSMQHDGLRISRATIYSTLDLLTRCDILTKHHFAGERAQFELADKMPNHDHLICTDCGHIVEFQQEELHDISEKVSKELNFTPLKHSLQIFAVCSNAGACEHKKP